MPSNESATAGASRRVYGVYCFGLVVSFLLLILIVAIIIVLLLVEGKDAAIILPVLIVILITTIAGSFIFMRWQSKKASAKQNRQEVVVHQTPNHEQLSRMNTDRSSWAFWRKTSSESTSGRPIPSAPPASTNSSMSSTKKSVTQVSPPGYQAVSTSERNT